MRAVRTISVVVAMICAPSILLPTGCAGNGDAAMKSFQSEIDALSRELDETTHALEISETLNTQLEASNDDLHARITKLESEKKKELENLQLLRDQDSAFSSRRIRELNAQIGALREEIQGRQDLNNRQATELAEAAHSIDQLMSSNEALRKQIAAGEREKIALTEDLRASKSYRARAMMILAIVVVGSVVVGFLSRNARARRAESDMLLRMNTAQNRREAS